MWVTIDPEADYDAARASIEEVVHGYPGLQPRRGDLPLRTDRSGPGGIERPHHRADLRAGPGDPRVARPRRCGRSFPGSTGSRTRGSPPSPRSRPSRSRSTSMRPSGTRSCRATSAGGRDAALRHPGRQPLRRSEGVRRRGVGNAGGPARSLQRRGSRDRYPRRAGRCGWAMWPTCGSGRPPRSSDTWTSPGASTSPAPHRVATSAPSSTTCRPAWARSSSRWSTTRRSSETTRTAGRRIGRRWASRSPRRSPSSCWCRRPSATGAWRR